MFKLYKRNEKGEVIAYHEAWAEPKRRRIVEHWGALGDAGQTEVHRIWFFGSLEKQFENILGPARGIGFQELDPGDFQTLIIEYADLLSGSDDDRVESEVAAERVNEILGWTGLGYCDDDTDTEDKIDIICRVIDPGLATEVIAAGLSEDPLLGTYTRMYQE